MSDSLDLLNDWLAGKRKEGLFPIPANAGPSQISLESAEDKFEPDFLKGLYVLEKAMLEKGLNPSDFILKKHVVVLPSFGKGVAMYMYDYNISFHGNTYSVRREGDMDFLAYFSTLCLSEEHEEIEEPHERSKTFFTKLIKWLEADAFSASIKKDDRL